MVSIGEDDGRIERFDLFDAQRLDGAVRADGHKDGSLDIAMLRMDNATAGFAIFFDQRI